MRSLLAGTSLLVGCAMPLPAGAPHDAGRPAAPHDAAVEGAPMDLATPSRSDLAAAGDLAAPDLAALDLAAPDLAARAGPTGDLAENVAATWGVGESQSNSVEPCAPVARGKVALAVETMKVMAGAQAVRVDYGPDGAKYFQAFCPKTRDADWDLSHQTVLAFWLDAGLPQSYVGWDYPGPTVVLCSDGGYRRLDPAQNLLPKSPAGYVGVQVPLAGGGAWKATDVGAFDPTHVRSFELHMNPDRQNGTGDCHVWFDGVHFG